ncbi:MAG: hypothetical protein ACOC9W_03485 [Persicimonas sp.]
MSDVTPKMLEGVGRLALVGVAKNCGKTTTLNYLLGSPATDGRTVGLVSIGIDGEASDLLIGTKKPPIHVEAGHWLVTARDALTRSSARVEYVDSLGFSTPLGEVVLARVLEPGTVVLAGVRHRGDLEAALELLEVHGVDLALIDGAYGRTLAARGDVSDAVIVSTGAILSEDVEVICERTAELVDRLALEPVEADWQERLLRRAITQGRCLLGGPQTAPVELPAQSALLGLRQAVDLWRDEIRAVAVPGLVSDSVVEQLLGAPVGQIQSGDPKPVRTLLVPDGTVLHADSRLLRRLLAHAGRGWQIRAIEPANVVAISINPTGVQGHRVEPGALGRALAERWPSICIFNPLHSNAAPA